MDRQLAGRAVPGQRFPHTRGDGPDPKLNPSPTLMFSPHPWGWTEEDTLGTAVLHLVFPTPVGMDLQMAHNIFGKRCFPHTRGDGPAIPRARRSTNRFSPHPWGWTVGVPREHGFAAVFPTPVGMDLISRSSASSDLRFPHTRGDGPRSRRLLDHAHEFSPHPWGWTLYLLRGRVWCHVFPTPVGMDRDPAATISASPSFPHTRGDGPLLADFSVCPIAFSPHPWGWTAQTPGKTRAVYVFPTPVGMDRSRARSARLQSRFPHTRGDGPVNDLRACFELVFSPHPWGWTARGPRRLSGPQVFPTPVGMDRTSTHTPTNRGGFPHTRGDGPPGGDAAPPTE